MALTFINLTRPGAQDIKVGESFQVQAEPAEHGNNDVEWSTYPSRAAAHGDTSRDGLSDAFTLPAEGARPVGAGDQLGIWYLDGRDFRKPYLGYVQVPVVA